RTGSRYAGSDGQGGRIRHPERQQPFLEQPLRQASCGGHRVPRRQVAEIARGGEEMKSLPLELKLIAITALACTPAATGWGQAFPSKPIHCIVPSSPGG